MRLTGTEVQASIHLVGKQVSLTESLYKVSHIPRCFLLSSTFTDSLHKPQLETSDTLPSRNTSHHLSYRKPQGSSIKHSHQASPSAHPLGIVLACHHPRTSQPKQLASYRTFFYPSAVVPSTLLAPNLSAPDSTTSPPLRPSTDTSIKMGGIARFRGTFLCLFCVFRGVSHCVDTFL